MGTRGDFQRLLEDMDKVIQQKRQELSELDARLEVTRNELIEKESKELVEEATRQDDDYESALLAKDELLSKQREEYERKLAQQREEIDELEYINQELVSDNESLNNELSRLNDLNENLKAKSYVLNESIEELKSANFELNMQFARAESESKMQQKLLKKCHEQDQVLMDAFNDKMESMRKAIAKRDEEIARLRSESQITLRSLGLTSESLERMDLDTVDDAYQVNRNGNLVDSVSKQRVIDIVAIVEEKDAQIEMLKKQLLQATRDIEKDAAVLESLTKHNKLMEIHDSDSSTHMQVLNRCKMLEDELKLKDNYVHSVEYRNRNFEVIIPTRLMELIQVLMKYKPSDVDSVELLKSIASSLKEVLTNIGSTQQLLNDIESIRRESRAKSRQIERLVKELNEFGSTSDALPINIDVNGKNDLISVSKSPKRVHFADDSFDGEGRGQTSKSGEVSGPKQDDKSTDRTDKEEPVRLESSKSESTQQPYQPSSSRTFQMTKYYGLRSRGAVEHTTKVATLQKRIKQLEDENELLELAMKEILLSIKWSDAKCGTILIDCPSLERLCQLIEARFLTLVERRDLPDEAEQQNRLTVDQNGQSLNRGEVFQLIVMKSELDLIRGQNEQLRTDIKMQKRDQRELLSQLSRDRVSDPQEHNEGEDNIDANCCDAGCQTETIVPSGSGEESTSDHSEASINSETVQESPKKANCRNCQRLVALANHLLECIVRIECRVSLSDETYMSRLLTLYQFTQRLATELDAQSNLLNDSRRDYHNVVQEKLRAEARLVAAEAKLNAHLVQCPLLSTETYMLAGQMESLREKNIVGSTSKRVAPQEHSVNSGMTISLLQSIIGCLQARLEYKDERLKQLEQQFFHDTPESSTSMSIQPEMTSPKTMECT